MPGGGCRDGDRIGRGILEPGYGSAWPRGVDCGKEGSALRHRLEMPLLRERKHLGELGNRPQARGVGTAGGPVRLREEQRIRPESPHSSKSTSHVVRSSAARSEPLSIQGFRGRTERRKRTELFLSVRLEGRSLVGLQIQKRNEPVFAARSQISAIRTE